MEKEILNLDEIPEVPAIQAERTLKEVYSEDGEMTFWMKEEKSKEEKPKKKEQLPSPQKP